jgi:very-short-patch-repair endonuclease
MTPAEAKLWTRLSRKQLEGRKLRRQHSIDGYILDFYCPSERLAVELDAKPITRTWPPNTITSALSS